MTTDSTKSCCATGAGESCEISASCRAPLGVLLVSAAVWLIISSVLGLIASLKFHSPDFLGGCEWFTYGRVHPAAVNALIYGFVIPSGLGVALWIFARMGKTTVAHPLLIAAGAKFWNFGVLLGVVGILAGNSTGYEGLEMPRFAIVLLFLGYLLMAVFMTATLHQRSERKLEPAQWLLLAALLWFPWIYSTANLLLLKFHVRGVAQNVVAWWFSANLQTVWLGLTGVAILFYFVPKIMKRPLHSGYWALFTFWTLALFGSWTGIPSTAPVPAWLPTASAVATVLTLLPVFSVVMNLGKTIGGDCAPLRSDVAGPFFKFALPAFVLAALMNIASVLPCVGAITNFTWFTVAQSHLQIYGFFAMIVFGAVYHLAPRMTGVEWCKPGLIRAHFSITAIGVLLLVIPLAIGGVVEGMEWNDPANAPMVVAKSTLHFLRMSTMGETLILLGNLVFLVNLVCMVKCCVKKLFPMCCGSESACETPTAEVKP